MSGMAKVALLRLGGMVVNYMLFYGVFFPLIQCGTWGGRLEEGKYDGFHFSFEQNSITNEE